MTNLASGRNSSKDTIQYRKKRRRIRLPVVHRCNQQQKKLQSNDDGTQTSDSLTDCLSSSLFSDSFYFQ